MFTAKEVLTVLDKSLNLNEDSILHDDNCFNKITIPLSQTMKDYNIKCSVDNGASKACVFFEHDSRVFKIPFNSKGIGLGPFHGATNKNLQLDNAWDYCALESAIYEKAREYKLEQYFAAESCIGYINNYPIYVQEKAIPFNYIREVDYKDKKMLKRLKKVSKYCKKRRLNCFCGLWIADFFDEYGKREFKRLSKFLSKFNIGDLREVNIGYLNDKPILFDYSGYRG